MSKNRFNSSVFCYRVNLQNLNANPYMYWFQISERTYVRRYDVEGIKKTFLIIISPSTLEIQVTRRTT